MTTNFDIKNLRFQKMVEEVEDYAILLLDREGTIENWNKGAEKIKGYKAKEIIGKNFRIFYSPEDQQIGLPDKLLNTALNEGKARHEGWRVKKNGEKFWGSVLLTAIHDSEGGVIGFTKVTRDLTEKKITEENLRRSEARYQNMISEIQDYAIILLDVTGNIENWNKGAEKIKGYKANEIIGKNFRTFYTPEDLAENKPGRLLEKAATEGRSVDEGWRIRKNGTRFWGSITITSIHNEAGDIIGFTKITRDLTDIKRANETLMHMQRMEARNDELEQLTYITSHDLQEPLRNITSFIDMFAEDFGSQLNDEANETLRFIKEATTRMSKLINGLLDYGRLGRNTEISEIDTSEIVKEVCADFSTLIRETGSRIETSNLPVIKGFKTEFRLLLQNLIGNAIKFRQKGVAPEVQIYAEQKDGIWKFTVKDNGIGIEPKYLDRIFLIFQRLHSRRDFDGNGIGLAHSKRIAELHHGRIWVTSKPGQGSCFYFTINTNNF
jgi:PAS domain S-box-containing protein